VARRRTQVKQTHASNHPATATATETHSKQSKVRRVAAEEGESNDSTAQHTQHTARRRFRWVVVGSSDGLLKPEPLVLADQGTRSESRPTSPQTGAGVGREATKLPRYSVSDRTSTTGPGFAARPCAACLVHRRRGKDEGMHVDGQREVSVRVYERQPRLTKLTYADSHKWPRP
jgi:hypothetical protein